MLALEDSRFDVRSQAARSLAAIVEKNPIVRVDSERRSTRRSWEAER